MDRTSCAALEIRPLAADGFLRCQHHAISCLNKDVLTDPSSWDFPDAMLVALMDVVIVAYLLRSKRVRDVFRDFPDPARP